MVQMLCLRVFFFFSSIFSRLGDVITSHLPTFIIVSRHISSKNIFSALLQFTSFRTHLDVNTVFLQGEKNLFISVRQRACMHTPSASFLSPAWVPFFSRIFLCTVSLQKERLPLCGLISNENVTRTASPRKRCFFLSLFPSDRVFVDTTKKNQQQYNLSPQIVPCLRTVESTQKGSTYFGRTPPCV